MAYYVGTQQFPSVYAAARYLAANPQPGVSITSAPVAPAGMMTGGTMYAGGTPNFDERTGQSKGKSEKKSTKQTTTSKTSSEKTTQKPTSTTTSTSTAQPKSEMTFTFIEGSERGDAKPGELWGQTVEPKQVTESELRDYFNDPKRTNRLPEVFGTFENYLGYMTEREQLLQSGELTLGDWGSAANISSPTETITLEDGTVVEIPAIDIGMSIGGGGELGIGQAGGGGGAYQAGETEVMLQQGAYDDWLNSEVNSALLQKYGVSPVVYSETGDKFQWNGSSYVKTINEDHAGLGDYVKMAMITAVGILSSGALAPALSGGAAAGTAASIGGQVGASVLTNALTQAFTTGSIDFEQLLETAATAGLGAAVSQIVGPAIADKINLDISNITGIEQVDNVLEAMGQTAIRQAVFDGELDMDQIVSSGLFAGAKEIAGFLLDGIVGQQEISEEKQKELEQRYAEYAAIVDEDTMEEVNRVMANTVNEAIAAQQNEAMANQLQALSSNLQSIYEDAYRVSPEPTGPSVEDVMASSVDDPDSELADTTADLTADTTAQPEPMAQITDPFADRVSENGLVYASDENGNMRLVGIDPSSSPEDLLKGIRELAEGDIYGHQFADGRNVISLNEDMITALVNQAGGASELAAYLENEGIYVVFDSRSNNLVALMGEGVTGGLHTNVNADSYLDDEWSPPSINERPVPPPEPPTPEVLQDLESISLEELRESSVAAETPDTPLDLEVEVDPFEYEEEPELTPEPPPEPEPEIEPVEQQEQEQAPGEAGTASPSPDPTRQDDPSFAPAPTPAPQPAPQPAPAPAPAPAPQPEPEPEPARTPQEEAPITTGMFEEYFPPAPAPAPAAPPASAPAPAPSASTTAPPAPGTATGTTPESSAPATTGVGTGSGTGAPAGETYEQGSLIGDARALIEQALLNGATPEYLQENFPQYSDIITEVSSQVGTVPTQQPSVTTEDVEGIVSRAVEAIPEGMTPEQVSGIVNEAIGNIEFPEGMTASEVSGIVDNAINNIQFPEGLSTEDVENIVENAIFGIDFPESATMEDVNRAIAGAGFATSEAVEAGQAAATEERRNLQQAIISAQGNIEALDANTRQQFEEFGGTVNELFSDVNVDIEALQAGQISQAEAQQAFQQSTEEQFGELGSQVGELGTQLGGLASDVSGIGRGLEGLGEGVAGLGAGLGMGLLSLGQQQQQLAAQLAKPEPIPFDPFLKGLSPFQPLTPIALAPQKQTDAMSELNKFLGRQTGMLV